MPFRVPRPQAGDYVAEDYADYIRLVPPDRDLLAVYSEQADDVDAFYRDLTEGQAAHRYAEGKCSLKEMRQAGLLHGSVRRYPVEALRTV